MLGKVAIIFDDFKSPQEVARLKKNLNQWPLSTDDDGFKSSLEMAKCGRKLSKCHLSRSGQRLPKYMKKWPLSIDDFKTSPRMANVSKGSKMHGKVATLF